MKLVAPSILAANFNRLGEEVEMLNRSEADFVHCDVMDGVFVPNISFGIPIIQAVNQISIKPLDVHLMIVNPDKYISDFFKAGASIITVHYEACTHLHRTIQQIKSLGIKASVCLNPHSPVALLEDIISELDMVLLMSVNPGFGGQLFIENTYQKVVALKEMILKRNLKTQIEVDGGVNFEVGKKLYESGVDILVAGSFVFNANSPIETIAALKKL
ncbi:ribulose-phosphate 3-epimerase [Aquipluma nitroreducens]|uniref:Ribulose-phosphate 3-epimerase n=1 Tax=Aquipluma nitroreducens TaxID=2010828 RepID=A0A5K7SFW9_9BACT|nr:ribulose-phosphate 3-epimerase [Aquipluma nitroreducens]BBE20376.1 ribulose-phosphate 3-epimerase [Aquipluma nitroreducens]